MSDRVVLEVTAFEDLIDRIAKFDSVTIGDKVYPAEVLIRQLTIDAKDILTESQMAGAFAVTWGINAATARRHFARVSAAYRQWRDRTWLEIKGSVNETTGKFPTDSHTEKALRTTAEYGAWRARMDDAQYQAELAEAIYESFKTKSASIKEARELMRTEAGGAYVVVESERSMVPRQPQHELRG